VQQRGSEGDPARASTDELADTAIAPADLEAGDTEVFERSPDSEKAYRDPVAGTRIGRYHVSDVLGRGSMGVVVSAYDPRLDRRVAIKLVTWRANQDREELRARLLREARAMAKIRHPNVISVHEVGEHQGRIFLAMEQVEGGTLRQALETLQLERPGDWRAVVDLFVAAGRGLAAAHEAGIVHRDFKPENVLVDRDGRVLVGDFGLVGSHAEPSAPDAERLDRLTRDDVVMGTPAYMAPEQYTGSLLDGRADQFAFCVALYEALYGIRPFAGATPREYARAIMRGEIRAPPADRQIPGWLHALLVRGLAADAADRHPSMKALLAELGADPSWEWTFGRKTRAIALFAAGVLGLLIPSAILYLGAELSYSRFFVRNAALLAVFALIAWLGRKTFARTSTNRKLIALGLVGAGLSCVLAIGAHTVNLPVQLLGMFQLLLVASIMATASTTLDRRAWPCAAVYSAGFLIATTWPGTLPLVVLASHTILVATLLVIFLIPRDTARRASAN
jgi:tRNA A-37 threonylcarbamoyl transferase component Bud32